MTSATLRSWLPLVIVAGFAGVFLIRLTRLTWLQKTGRAMIHEEGTVKHGGLLGPLVEQAFAEMFTPVVRGLSRIGVKPDTLTFLSLATSIFVGFLIARGELLWGGFLGLLGASLDHVDGRLARHSGCATKAGSFLDSTLDRYADAALLGGAAVFFRHSAALLACSLLALASSLVISYARAKAESLGARLKAGLMQRPERTLLFCLGALLSPAFDPWLGAPRLFAASLVLLAFLSTITAVHRTVAGFQTLRRQE